MLQLATIDNRTMEFFFTIIYEAIFVFLLGYSGAFIRWIFSRKNSFKEILDSNMFVNAAIGAIAFTGLFLLYIFIQNAVK